MSEPEGDRKPGEEHVCYVQVSDPPLLGWRDIVGPITELDRAIADDYNKDVGTLLTFAGLYSAVLTAFIIESYKSLQPDKQDIVIGLLQQMVVQTFIAGPGYLNSTALLPRPPPFEPPLWAIRVNVLWFSGLMLSLAAASIGILVKQWLQEYLASDYVSPRDRLRARQYRTPALSQWGVFEIAALLPLLLQISLGLFFLGLCIFTSAIHASVGYTTLPLAVAWIFLIFITTIAPLFSPRCPYKTKFLKGALKAGRRIVAPPSRQLAFAICRQVYFLLYRLQSVVFGCTEYLASQGWARLALQYGELCVGGVSAVLQKLVVTRTSWVNSNALLEEEKAVREGQQDVGILRYANNLISDDGILPLMLHELLPQAHSGPALVIEFVVGIIQQRTGQILYTTPLTVIPDLREFSKHAWHYLTDGVARALARYGDSPLRSGTPDSVVDAVIFLLSHSSYELSDLAARTLQGFLASDTEDACISGTIVGRRLVPEYGHGSPRCPGLSQGSLVASIANIKGARICLKCIMDVYIPFLCQDPRHDHTSLHDLLATHLLSEPQEFVARSRAILDDVLDLVLEIISKVRRKGRGDGEARYIIVQYGATLGRTQHAISLCRRMLASPSKAPQALNYFAAVDVRARVSSDSEHIFADTIVSANAQEQSDIMDKLNQVLRHYCNGIRDSGERGLLDLVRVCRLCLQAYLEVSQSGTSSPKGFLQWQRLWGLLSNATKKYYEEEAWKDDFPQDYWYLDIPSMAIDDRLAEDGVLACECLDLLVSHLNSMTTAGSTDIDDTPAVLVGPLWLFIPQERMQDYEALHRFLPLPPSPLPTPAPLPALSPAPEVDGERIRVEPDGADKADEQSGSVERAGEESGATNKAVVAED